MKIKIKKDVKVGKNLTLTGMMGVGKSTIGKKLAKKLKYNFIDVDKIIEAKEGQSINSIFKNKSEAYFRKIENEITIRELKKDNSVISLGGGAFLNKSIRKNAKKFSVSFWLDVPLEQLVKRLKKGRQRPFYIKTLQKRLKKFILIEKIYNKADYRIKCNSKSFEITNKILDLYERS